MLTADKAQVRARSQTSQLQTKQLAKGMGRINNNNNNENFLFYFNPKKSFCEYLVWSGPSWTRARTKPQSALTRRWEAGVEAQGEIRIEADWLQELTRRG